MCIVLVVPNIIGDVMLRKGVWHIVDECVINGEVHPGLSITWPASIAYMATNTGVRVNDICTHSS